MKEHFGDFVDRYMKDREYLINQYGEDFDKPSGTSFQLNKAEVQCINNWVESLRPEILAIQKARPKGTGIDDILEDEPYYGATGGGLKYSFTPTSLGTILTVKESITGKELNVSDALLWHFYG